MSVNEDHPIDPGARLDTELGRLLEAHLAKARKACRKSAKKRPHEDAVHDARTALRRLEVALDVARALGALPPTAKHAQEALHAAEQALGEARDDDVFLETLGKSELANDRSLVAAAKRARHHRARAARTARDVVLGPKTERAFHAARKLARRASKRAPAQEPSQRRRSPRAEPELVRHRVEEALARAYSAILAYDARVDGGPPSDGVIHKVRSAARSLRYTLELFAGALSPAAEPMIAELHGLQTRLGNLHDDVVALERLRRWVDRGKIAPTPSVRAYLRARDEARERARQSFTREWKALDGFHRRLSELTREPG